MIRLKKNYFCDVAKMVIIHKKIATFGYKQVIGNK
jgi:hypothetical protein